MFLSEHRKVCFKTIPLMGIVKIQIFNEIFNFFFFFSKSDSVVNERKKKNSLPIKKEICFQFNGPLKLL